jgi:hypothetical protein
VIAATYAHTCNEASGTGKSSMQSRQSRRNFRLGSPGHGVCCVRCWPSSRSHSVLAMAAVALQCHMVGKVGRRARHLQVRATLAPNRWLSDSVLVKGITLHPETWHVTCRACDHRQQKCSTGAARLCTAVHGRCLLTFTRPCDVWATKRTNAILVTRSSLVDSAGK